MKNIISKSIFTFLIFLVFSAVPVLAAPTLKIDYDSSKAIYNIFMENVESNVYSAQIELIDYKNNSNFSFENSNSQILSVLKTQDLDNAKKITIYLDNPNDFLNKNRAINLGTLKSEAEADFGKTANAKLVDKDFKGTVFKNIQIKYNKKDITETITEVETGNSIKLEPIKEETVEDKKDVIIDNSKEENTLVKFKDISNHWGKNAIEYLASKGFVNGLNEDTFDPDNKIKRSEFVTILAKIDNIDEGKFSTDTFKDVKSSDWFLPYVAWAEKSGITSGLTKDEFAPNQNITREQMSVMIYKFAKYKNYKLPIKSEYVEFSDSSKIASYAKEAVKAVKQAGIVNGKGNNMFAPKDTATRAESCQMLYSLLSIQ